MKPLAVLVIAALIVYCLTRPRRYVTGCQCATCRRHRPGWPWT